MPFGQLGLIEPLVRAVSSEGYSAPTPIQKLAIPPVLEGKDLLGCAQTGTGKTAAFALPILQRMQQTGGHAAHPHYIPHPHNATQPQLAHAQHGHSQHAAGGHAAKGHGAVRKIRTLILAPTRELAAQIGDSFTAYGRHAGLRHTVIFGGVKQGPQTAALRKGVDIVIATPGRLMDLMNQNLLTLRHLEILVLDEADRMLDMGFIHDIRRIVEQVPPKRQTLLFSATMPREIRALADTLMNKPVEVKVKAENVAADTVGQTLYHIESTGKGQLLEQILTGDVVTRALVFTRTKRGADRVAKRLLAVGVSTEAIHSNKSQNYRVRALGNFKAGRTRVLVASDIAARGLDVEEISHVINYDLPNEPETYVHRIGRTGRAGASGQAISFCSRDERDQLRDIERLLGRPIPVLPHSIKCAPAAFDPEERRPRSGYGRQRASGGHGQGGQRSGGGYGQGGHAKGGHGQGGHSQRQSHQAGTSRPANRHQAQSGGQTSQSAEGGGHSGAAGQSTSSNRKPTSRRRKRLF